MAYKKKLVIDDIVKIIEESFGIKLEEKQITLDDAYYGINVKELSGEEKKFEDSDKKIVLFCGNSIQSAWYIMFLSIGGVFYVFNGIGEELVEDLNKFYDEVYSKANVNEDVVTVADVDAATNYGFKVKNKKEEK